MPLLRRIAVLGFLLALSAVAGPAAAQDLPRQPYPPDARYYDFWPGTWYQVVNGVPDTTGTRFEVRAGPYPATWIEVWRMKVAGDTVITAHALRAWDAARGRWGYLWVSSEGHFQVWDGTKVGDDWYIYRHFTFPRDRYLSRQAWLPLGPGRLQRISQKSYDEGVTWELRFSEEYLRVSDP